MCRCTSKAFLGVLSLVFWLVAAGLIFIGVWVFTEYHHYEEIGSATYTLLPATILLGAGGLFFVLGIIGCVGAFKEQKCLLAMFFTVLLIIMVGLIVCAALAYVYRGDIETNVRKGFQDTMDKYGMPNETVYTEELDLMQQDLKCCGMDNYTDWLETPWYKQQTEKTHVYPESCCHDNNCTYPVNDTANDTMLYTDGCYHMVKNQFLTHLGVIGGVGLSFSIILILGMVFSCVLICRRTSEVPYIGLSDPQGMRV